MSSTVAMVAILTFYGVPDNSPRNTATIARPVVHRVATEDTGEYERPITLATSSRFAFGTKFYIPRLRKYAVVEDRCGACERDAKRGKVRLDLFVGPSTVPDNPKGLLLCQRALTHGRREAVILNPDAGLPVSTERLC